MRAGKRNIKSGVEFEHLVSKPTGKNELIKKNSKLEDTVKFLPKAIRQTYKQAEKIAPLLEGRSIEETTKKIWYWAFNHFQYEIDQKFKEQIRSFRRSFFDRHAGIDCDDYTVLISSLLSCLNIKHILRVAKYKEEQGFQHIYIIVPLDNGRYITLDCVVDEYDYEVPFIDKIDTKMDLEFLDGIDGIEEDADLSINGIDADDLMNGLEYGDLGLPKLKNTKVFQAVKKGVTTATSTIKTAATTVKAAVKTGLHVVNKVNPATVLLRAGILAAMKLNMFKVAEQLRYAYLDPNTAARQNFDMGKWNRLKGVKDKLEKIFFGAGGTVANFKSAILTGNGNSNKEVPISGLGEVDYNNYNEQHTLSQILGVNTYTSEMSGVEGLGSLGEPATATALAAATSVLAAIAGLLKSIGSLKKGKESEPVPNAVTNTTTTPEITSDSQATSIINDTYVPESITDSASSETSAPANPNGGENKSFSTETPADSATPATTSDENATSTDVTTTNAKESAKETAGTFDKIKDWVSKNKVAAGLIVATTIGLAAWGISALNKKKEPTQKAKGAVSGVPNNNKSKRSKKQKKNKKRSSITYQKLR